MFTACGAVWARFVKFGKLAPFTVAGFDAIDCMVCDEAPDGQLAALMARERVEIIC